jgi:hypothetical protein
MRIKLGYLIWAYSDSDSIGVALKSATSSIIAFIEKLLQVNRAGLTITITRCYDVDVPAADRNTQLPYDLAIYATSLAGSGYFANAVACQLNPSAPNNPMVGRISYNTAEMSASVTTGFGFQTLSRVAFH